LHRVRAIGTRERNRQKLAAPQRLRLRYEEKATRYDREPAHRRLHQKVDGEAVLRSKASSSVRFGSKGRSERWL
jgi:hypothetical protein